MKNTVISILNILTYNNARIIVKDVALNYNRIATQVIDEYNVFRATNRYAKFYVKPSDKELNINVQLTIEGKVTINPNFTQRVGFDTNTFDCVKFRNYAIVKDGKLNKDTIRVATNGKTYRRIKKYTSDLVKNGKIYEYDVNFAGLKVTNKKCDTVRLYNLTKTLTLLKVTDKAVKAVLKNRVLDANTNTYTPEQIALLADYGINGNVYSGIANNVNADNTATYTAAIVTTTIKGEASIPSVNAVLKKVPTRGIGKLLYDTYTSYQTLDTATLNKIANNVKYKIANIQSELAELRLAYANAGNTTAEYDYNGDIFTVTVDSIEKQYTAA